MAIWKLSSVDHVKKVAVFLIVLGIIVAITCIKKLVLMKKENAEKAEA